MRRIGCQGDRKTIQRYREALATGFNVSLLLCPATEKGFGVIGLRPDVFEINADVGGSGDGDEGKTGRVREIEFEPVGEFRTKIRLAERVVNKAYLARLG